MSDKKFMLLMEGLCYKNAIEQSLSVMRNHENLTTEESILFCKYMLEAVEKWGQETGRDVGIKRNGKDHV